MKIVPNCSLLLVVVAILMNPVLADDPQPVGDVLQTRTGQWELLPEHSDEFNASEIDRKKWNIDTEDWGTWSWEPENASVSDGSLNLKMVQESHQRKEAKLDYKSGIARNNKTITYGYFEARVKSCDLYPGASPAFWLCSKGPENRYSASDGETVVYSEIDIIELQQGEFENKKRNEVNRIDCNLHAVLMKDGKRQWVRPNKFPEMCKNAYDSSWDPRDDYHIYAMENSADWVVWYIDGKEVARKPNLYWHLPMHVILSLGLRSPFEKYEGESRMPVPAATTKEGFPTTMLVDYVRVWQNSSPAKPGTQVAKTETPAPKKMSPTDKTKAEWVALEKPKWEKNGWAWSQTKVESNFDEMDVNQDGLATGQERQAWYESKKK